MLLELQQKQDEVRHREELLQTFKEQAEQSASKVCATVIAVETDYYAIFDCAQSTALDQN